MQNGDLVHIPQGAMLHTSIRSAAPFIKTEKPTTGVVIERAGPTTLSIYVDGARYFVVERDVYDIHQHQAEGEQKC
jgi:hypothetical protein